MKILRIKGICTRIICCLFIAINCFLVNILAIKKAEKIAIAKSPYKYIGKFTITHYCPCKLCVGNKKVIKTATGTTPKALYTVAVDPKVIPLKSIIFIPDIGYCVAEDTGKAIKGHKIDIFVDNHETALKMGTQKRNIYLVK